ncbi:MAG: YggT family protein [Gemmatimonadota bacterium]
MFIPILLQAIRALVFTSFALASGVALVHWAVRSRKMTPFGALPRAVRRLSDPVVKPLERRIVRAGGNPQDAPLWLLGIVVVGGLILITTVNWLIATIYVLISAPTAGPRAVLRLVLSGVFWVLQAALIVRVIASWLSLSPHKPWMRPVMVLTNWIIEPLQRVVPPLGMIDVTPMVAYFLLWLAERFVMGML